MRKAPEDQTRARLVTMLAQLAGAEHLKEVRKRFKARGRGGRWMGPRWLDKIMIRCVLRKLL